LGAGIPAKYIYKRKDREVRESTKRFYKMGNDN